MFQRIFSKTKNKRTANRVARRVLFRGLRYENLEKRDLMTGDLGANFFSQATWLTTDNDRVLQDQVGGSDPIDYFKFDINRQSVVDIDLTELLQDIDLKLFDSNGRLLGASTRGGARSESIERTLPAGTYVIQAYPYKNAQSNYRMSIDINQVAPLDHAGNSMSNARNIGTLSGTTTFNDFVSSTGDRDDYYRVNLAQTSNFNLVVTGMSSDADVEVLDSIGNRIAGSGNWGSSNESINRQLAAGTYYTRVLAYQGETTYTLRLEADAVAAMPPSRVNVQATAASSNQVLLTWNDASNEDSYIIFRWNGSSEQQIGTANQNATSFTVTGLEAGQRHWFYVRSQNSAGSTNSFWVFLDTPVANWAIDTQVVTARAQLAGLSSWGASMYRQLDLVPLQNTSGNRSHDAYARVIEQFNVQDTSRSTNISNRYTRGGYDNWDTRCNIFAGDVMRAMNAPLPTKSTSDPMFRNANSLNNWLNSNEGLNAGWTRIDLSTATGLQQLLNHVRAGRPALASLNSSINTVSGHIAVIRPDQPGAVASLADVLIAQAGAWNFNNNTINYGFGGTSGVEVFIHA
jgi:Bacterial pre-peptidase C-terminal domain